MNKAQGRILKSSDVKLQGRLQLDMAKVDAEQPTGKKLPLAAPQVRAVEKHPEFAVIEITCSCGTKTLLKCEYAADEQPAAAEQ